MDPEITVTTDGDHIRIQIRTDREITVTVNAESMAETPEMDAGEENSG